MIAECHRKDALRFTTISLWIVYFCVHNVSAQTKRLCYEYAQPGKVMLQRTTTWKGYATKMHNTCRCGFLLNGIQFPNMLIPGSFQFDLVQVVYVD